MAPISNGNTGILGFSPRTGRYVILSVTLALLCACGSLPRVPVSDYELDPADGITLAGILNPDAIAQLQTDDAVVIDLRTAQEGVAEEAEQMKQAGISYFNLPVGRDGLSDTITSDFAALLEEHKGRPVVVHCRSGNRAGLLWATYLIEEGYSVTEALAAVDDIVTSEGIRTAIKQTSR